MNAKVEDPMGLETGIRIDMVRTVWNVLLLIETAALRSCRSAATTDVFGSTGRRCLRSAWRMCPALSPGTTSASCSCGSFIIGIETRQVQV